MGRLVVDVPLGVFLSGGVDSSAIPSIMCMLEEPANVESFAIGFREMSYDESDHARAMAEFLGVSHNEKILSMDNAQEVADAVLAGLDEPMGDGSLLPTLLLCRFARTKVKVTLSGDGGDELFAGYDPFKALKPAALYNALVPGFVHKGMRSLAELLPKSEANMSFDFKVRRALQGIGYGPELWNPVWLAPLEPADFLDLFNEQVDYEELYSEVLSLWREDDRKSHVDKTLEFYTNFYLPDGILTKIDRASMLNGIEARSVFLDNDLVEYVRRLPAAYKMHGGKRKVVLKKALEGILPSNILARPKKGFGVPLMSWLRQIPLNASGASAIGLDTDEIERRILKHASAQEDHRLFLWCWNVLQHNNALNMATGRAKVS